MKKKFVYLLGAQKSGTTTLHNWLSQHSEINGPRSMKDFPFFVFDEYYTKGIDWFLSKFKSMDENTYSLHGYVSYMYFHEKFIRRIKENELQGKYILILRNPVDRAYSNYYYQKWRGIEKSKSFLQSVENEENIINSSDMKILGSLTHIDHGYYSKQIQSLFNELGRKNFLILFTEELKSKEILTKKIFDWLDLKNEDIIFNRENSSKIIKYKKFNSLLKGLKLLMPRVLKNLFSFHFRYKIRKALQNAVSEEQNYPKLDYNIYRQIYNQYYKLEIESLEKLIGHDLKKWKYE